jgi:hypothetical protein
MENAGTRYGKPVPDKNLTPCSWVMREVLTRYTPSQLTPVTLQRLIDEYAFEKNKGSTPASSVIVCAKTTANNNNSMEDDTVPVFIYEGNSLGGCVRLPADTQESGRIANQFILASNHFLKYGVTHELDKYQQQHTPAMDNSLYRYEVREEKRIKIVEH